MRKIAAIAESFHSAVVTHNFLGPVLTAAAVHLDTSIPNFVVQEYSRTDEIEQVVRLQRRAASARAATCYPQDTPGLGIRLVDASANAPLGPLGDRPVKDIPLRARRLGGVRGMKVLLVGGAGMVGTFVTPYLREQHALRVLDVRPPRHDGVEYVEGSITDPESLRRALDGVDTFINMVMKSPQGGSSSEQTLTQILENYEVNTLGLHLLLWTAQGMGIKRGVHTSTMSVHYRERTLYPAEEEVPLDTPSVYGLTKGFGELICAVLRALVRHEPDRAADHWAAHARSSSWRSGAARRPTVARHLYWTDEEDLAQRLPGGAGRRAGRARPLRRGVHRRRRESGGAQPEQSAAAAAVGAALAAVSRLMTVSIEARGTVASGSKACARRSRRASGIWARAANRWFRRIRYACSARSRSTRRCARLEADPPGDAVELHMRMLGYHGSSSRMDCRAGSGRPIPRLVTMAPGARSGLPIRRRISRSASCAATSPSTRPSRDGCSTSCTGVSDDRRLALPRVAHLAVRAAGAGSESRPRVEQLLFEMDQCGVDRGVVVAARIEHNPDNNDYVAECVQRYPERLYQFADVDCMWTDTYHQPGAAERLAQAVRTYRLRGFTHYVEAEDDGMWFLSDDGQAFLRTAAELNQIVSLSVPVRFQPTLRRIAEQFPDTPFVVHHMGIPVTAEGPDGAALREIVTSARHPNVHIKLSGFHYAAPVGWDIRTAPACFSCARCSSILVPSACTGARTTRWCAGR